MSDIKFPTDTPDITPVLSDRVLLSQTAQSGRATDAPLSALPFVETVTAGSNITVDNTNPKNPIISSTGGGGVWGTITGTLSNQTDLQNSLNAKENVANKDTDGTLSANSDTFLCLRPE